MPIKWERHRAVSQTLAELAVRWFLYLLTLDTDKQPSHSAQIARPCNAFVLHSSGVSILSNNKIAFLICRFALVDTR